MEAGLASRLYRDRTLRWAFPAALLLAVGTYLYLGPSADAAAWAAVQVVLVALTAIDVATRRLPNRITLPTAAVAVALRAIFHRSDLVEVVVAGLAAFAAFYVLALLFRGGLGMGDVKLAAMLGFLLGTEVVGALAVGILAGGIWAFGLVVLRRASMRTTMAYGPFLALGGSLAILFSGPPPLV